VETSSDLVEPRPGRGVWAFCDGLDAAGSISFARALTELGYSSLWLPETFGRDPFAHIAHLLAATDELVFATGIANIHNRHAGVMRQAALTLAEQAPGRFVLGLGVSHERTVEGVRGLDYSRPLHRMADYLDAYAAAPYRGPAAPAPPLVLGALGPRMVGLAAARADGVHTYSVTPAHTATTRAAIGPDALLYVEQKVILTSDRSAGLDAARRVLVGTSALPNYRRRWRALGFADTQIENLDAEFVEAIVAVGDADAVGRRLDEHQAAGATQVCVQALDVTGSPEPDLAALKELAPQPR